MIELDKGDRNFEYSYDEGVCLAIASRALELHSTRSMKRAKRAPIPLAKWRLRKAIDYIDAHLSDTVTLAGLAEVTGLTRMHFAAQFRAATGLRPHDYLLRRRIESAQYILSTTNVPLVEVALEVGFRTQAHFATVFKRFIGTTPANFRKLNLVSFGTSRSYAEQGQFAT